MARDVRYNSKSVALLQDPSFHKNYHWITVTVAAANNGAVADEDADAQKLALEMFHIMHAGAWKQSTILVSPTIRTVMNTTEVEGAAAATYIAYIPYSAFRDRIDQAVKCVSTLYTASKKPKNAAEMLGVDAMMRPKTEYVMKLVENKMATAPGGALAQLAKAAVGLMLYPHELLLLCRSLESDELWPGAYAALRAAVLTKVNGAGYAEVFNKIATAVSDAQMYPEVPFRDIKALSMTANDALDTMRDAANGAGGDYALAFQRFDRCRMLMLIVLCELGDAVSNRTASIKATASLDDMRSHMRRVMDDAQFYRPPINSHSPYVSNRPPWKNVSLGRNVTYDTPLGSYPGFMELCCGTGDRLAESLSRFMRTTLQTGGVYGIRDLVRSDAVRLAFCPGLDMLQRIMKTMVNQERTGLNHLPPPIVFERDGSFRQTRLRFHDVYKTNLVEAPVSSIEVLEWPTMLDVTTVCHWLTETTMIEETQIMKHLIRTHGENLREPHLSAAVVYYMSNKFFVEASAEGDIGSSLPPRLFPIIRATYNDALELHRVAKPGEPRIDLPHHLAGPCLRSINAVMSGQAPAIGDTAAALYTGSVSRKDLSQMVTSGFGRVLSAMSRYAKIGSSLSERHPKRSLLGVTELRRNARFFNADGGMSSPASYIPDATYSAGGGFTAFIYMLHLCFILNQAISDSTDRGANVMACKVPVALSAWIELRTRVFIILLGRTSSGKTALYRILQHLLNPNTIRHDARSSDKGSFGKGEVPNGSYFGDERDATLGPSAKESTVPRKDLLNAVEFAVISQSQGTVDGSTVAVVKATPALVIFAGNNKQLFETVRSRGHLIMFPCTINELPPAARDLPKLVCDMKSMLSHTQAVLTRISILALAGVVPLAPTDHLDVLGCESVLKTAMERAGDVIHVNGKPWCEVVMENGRPVGGRNSLLSPRSEVIFSNTVTRVATFCQMMEANTVLQTIGVLVAYAICLYEERHGRRSGIELWKSLSHIRSLGTLGRVTVRRLREAARMARYDPSSSSDSATMPGSFGPSDLPASSPAQTARDVRHFKEMGLHFPSEAAMTVYRSMLVPLPSTVVHAANMTDANGVCAVDSQDSFIGFLQKHMEAVAYMMSASVASVVGDGVALPVSSDRLLDPKADVYKRLSEIQSCLEMSGLENDFVTALGQGMDEFAVSNRLSLSVKKQFPQMGKTAQAATMQVFNPGWGPRRTDWRLESLDAVGPQAYGHSIGDERLADVISARPVPRDSAYAMIAVYLYVTGLFRMLEDAGKIRPGRRTQEEWLVRVFGIDLVDDELLSFRADGSNRESLEIAMTISWIIASSVAKCFMLALSFKDDRSVMADVMSAVPIAVWPGCYRLNGGGTRNASGIIPVWMRDGKLQGCPVLRQRAHRIVRGLRKRMAAMVARVRTQTKGLLEEPIETEKWPKAIHRTLVRGLWVESAETKFTDVSTEIEKLVSVTQLSGYADEPFPAPEDADDALSQQCYAELFCHMHPEGGYPDVYRKGLKEFGIRTVEGKDGVSYKSSDDVKKLRRWVACRVASDFVRVMRGNGVTFVDLDCSIPDSMKSSPAHGAVDMEWTGVGLISLDGVSGVSVVAKAAPTMMRVAGAHDARVTAIRMTVKDGVVDPKYTKGLPMTPEQAAIVRAAGCEPPPEFLDGAVEPGHHGAGLLERVRENERMESLMIDAMAGRGAGAGAPPMLPVLSESMLFPGEDAQAIREPVFSDEGVEIKKLNTGARCDADVRSVEISPFVSVHTEGAKEIPVGGDVQRPHHMNVFVIPGDSSPESLTYKTFLVPGPGFSSSCPVRLAVEKEAKKSTDPLVPVRAATYAGAERKAVFASTPHGWIAFNAVACAVDHALRPVVDMLNIVEGFSNKRLLCAHLAEVLVTSPECHRDTVLQFLGVPRGVLGAVSHSQLLSPRAIRDIHHEETLAISEGIFGSADIMRDATIMTIDNGVLDGFFSTLGDVDAPEMAVPARCQPKIKPLVPVEDSGTLLAAVADSYLEYHRTRSEEIRDFSIEAKQRAEALDVAEADAENEADGVRDPSIEEQRRALGLDSGDEAEGLVQSRLPFRDPVRREHAEPRRPNGEPSQKRRRLKKARSAPSPSAADAGIPAHGMPEMPPGGPPLSSRSLLRMPEE